ncbi:hypothetical protein [Glycomyces tenuis]|uniref:hypothetical protein n=1 Tax=Glycomyces tenuis TaxID=58116 RepID=UPI001B7F8CF1|nr:hypothetical protein [Glycomyces tenuis]
MDQLQVLIDTFAEACNHHRPPVAPTPSDPATVYNTRPKAAPGEELDTANPGRIRTGTIDKAGSATLHHNGRLHHIGIGRIYEGTRVLRIIEGLHIRVLNAATGETLRELTLDRQPTGRPKGPTRPT